MSGGCALRLCVGCCFESTSGRATGKHVDRGECTPSGTKKNTPCPRQRQRILVWMSPGKEPSRCGLSGGCSRRGTAMLAVGKEDPRQGGCSGLPTERSGPGSSRRPGHPSQYDLALRQWPLRRARCCWPQRQAPTMRGLTSRQLETDQEPRLDNDSSGILMK